MPIVINNLYDMLKLVESADTYDKKYAVGVCWDLYDDMTDPSDYAMTEIQKHIDIVSFHSTSYGIELTADISGFAKEHMAALKTISKHWCRVKMKSIDPEDEDSVYIATDLIGLMQCGYTNDDACLYLLKDVDKEKYEAWRDRYGGDWLDSLGDDADSYMQEVVEDFRKAWPKEVVE